ncbi:hypothetical protein ACK33D_15855 [Aeromonas hydrophila]|uniref:hypothetical protein n=1 Tax=Aeromonas hydrophila TaxID=644 RepID=UPI0039868D39
MAWIRRGTITTSAGERRITGVGTNWKNHQLVPRPGHLLVVQVPGGCEVLEVARVISDEVLETVEPWRLDAVTDSQYAVDTALIDSPSEYAQRIAAMFAYYQAQIDTLSLLMSADGEVTLTRPDGTQITVPSLSSVLHSVEASQKWFDTNLPLVEKAGQFAAEAKAGAQTATAKAGEATAAATTATTKSSQASASATNARQSETNAATSASSATSGAATATAAATTATDKAAIATNAAGSATESASSATASAQTATVKASEAVSAAQTATDKSAIAVSAANKSQGHEATASTAATTATEKATISVEAAKIATDKSAIAVGAATTATDSKNRAEAAAKKAEELVDQATGGSLLKEQNLADLPSAEIARQNLHVPSIDDLEAVSRNFAPLLPAGGAAFVYTNGLLTQMTEQLPAGERVTAYSYTEGRLTKAVETLGQLVRTTTYNYQAGILTGFTTTEGGA